jgi:uncharacterized protein YbjT (DUF2867 family)
MHLASSPLDDPSWMRDVAATVLSAAIGAGCRRIIWLSHLGVEAVVDDFGQGNPWLAACADVEELLADAPLESVVFRRALTYGPQDDLTTTLAAGAARGLAKVGLGRHAPLFADDLAAAVVAADRERVEGTTSHLNLVIPIGGPDILDLAEVVRSLRSATAPSRAHVTNARFPDPLADLYSRDLLPPPSAIGAHGTPFAVGRTRLSVT